MLHAVCLFVPLSRFRILSHALALSLSVRLSDFVARVSARRAVAPILQPCSPVSPLDVSPSLSLSLLLHDSHTHTHTHTHTISISPSPSLSLSLSCLSHFSLSDSLSLLLSLSLSIARVARGYLVPPRLAHCVQAAVCMCSNREQKLIVVSKGLCRPRWLVVVVLLVLVDLARWFAGDRRRVVP